MAKLDYTEYQELIEPDDNEISVIVQIPKTRDYPAHIIIQSGRRWLRYSLNEWSAINNVLMRSLKDAGWEE